MKATHWMMYTLLGTTLEPNDILYFFNYQIKYVLLFVI